MLLSNIQITKICSKHYHTKDTFEACLAFNSMPLIIKKYPCFYVVDVNYQVNSIGHWCACIFPSRESPCEFIDSLGKDPAEYHLELANMLSSNGNGRYIYNKTPVQHAESDSCGGFAIYLSDMRNQGLSMTRAINTLSHTDLMSNDDVVNKYLYTHMMLA